MRANNITEPSHTGCPAPGPVPSTTVPFTPTVQVAPIPNDGQRPVVVNVNVSSHEGPELSESVERFAELMESEFQVLENKYGHYDIRELIGILDIEFKNLNHAISLQLHPATIDEYAARLTTLAMLLAERYDEEF